MNAEQRSLVYVVAIIFGVGAVFALLVMFVTDQLVNL